VRTRTRDEDVKTKGYLSIANRVVAFFYDRQSFRGHSAAARSPTGGISCPVTATPMTLMRLIHLTGVIDWKTGRNASFGQVCKLLGQEATFVLRLGFLAIMARLLGPKTSVRWPLPSQASMLSLAAVQRRIIKRGGCPAFRLPQRQLRFTDLPTIEAFSLIVSCALSPEAHSMPRGPCVIFEPPAFGFHRAGGELPYSDTSNWYVAAHDRR
jgi:hypothetical protein